MFRFSSLSVLFSFLSCSNFSAEKLPSDWQKDMQLELYYYGGMTPESWRLIIALDSCVYERHEGIVEKKYVFRFTEGELNGILELLEKNRVTQIEMKELEGTIYDKATSGFTLHCGDKSFEVDPGATRSVKERYIENYRTIYDSVYALCMKKLEDQKVTIHFSLDTNTLRTTGAKLYLSVEYTDQSAQFNADNLPAEVTFRILPGIFSAQIHLIEANPNGSTKYLASFIGDLNSTQGYFDVSRAGEWITIPHTPTKPIELKE